MAGRRERRVAKSKPSLARTLGRTTATLLTAAMILGTGLFAALGETADRAGSGLLLAMLLSGLVALATGLSAASLGVVFPEEGGAFTWSRKFGHDTLGFVAGCAYLGKGVVSTVVISLAFATYSTRVMPELPAYGIHLAAAAAILFVATVSYFGLELNARLLIVTMLVELVLLAVFVAFAVPAMKPENLTPVLGNGIPGVLAGAAIFFWSWDGFMRTAIMASEIKDPRRTIPFAIVGGIAFAAVVFLAVGAATLGVLGSEAMARNDVPIFTAGQRAIGRWGIWVVLAAAWLDTLTEALGDLLTATRVALAMGKAHELPGWLAIVHPRFRSPHHAVLALGIACAVPALLFNLRPVLEAANVFTLVWYGIVHFDALQLREEERLTWSVVSWIGLAGCLALFVSLPAWALITGGTTLAALAGGRWLVRRESNRASRT
jgi:basic amino acid/polyamine antiporter, APA family